MTTVIAELAAHPFVERLGWTLFHFVWQAMIVSVIAAVALRVFRNATANRRYVGLCAGLLLLAAAPMVTFVALPADAQLDSDTNFAGDSRIERPAGITSVTHLELSGEPAPPLTGGRDVIGRDQSVVAEPNTRAGIAPTSLNQSSGSVQLDGAEASLLETRPVLPAAHATLRMRISAAAPWIVAVWLLGVGMLSVWHTTGWLLARRLTIRGTQPVTAATRAVLDSLKQRMGIRVSVRLLESTMASVPIVVSWLKPVLLMPASVLSGLPPDQLKAILAHELAHVRRHDFLVNVLQTCVETCLFYHPAVWWLSRQIRIEREYCADEEAAAVCEDRDTYARALVSLADSLIAVPRPAVAATGGALTNRIHRLLGLVSDRERAARRPSWLVSALLGLTVICSLIASTKSNARQTDAEPNETTPIKEIADRLEKSIADWQLLAVDDEPGVTVAGHRGFRVVLRRTWKEYINPPQQAAPSASADPAAPEFKLKTDDWEFVLVLDGANEVPVALKSQIEWMDRKSPYHTRDVCLGTGHGYVWFTRGTIFDQEHVRESLKLKGGDDRIQLVVDGVLVKDTNMQTAEICMQMPARFGDRAIPYIKRAVEKWLAKPRETGLWRLVTTLGYIPTSHSTATLLQLFDFPNAEVRSCAETGLCREPYRKAAKRAYLDMLRRNSRVRPVANACVEFGWTEAIPLLRNVIARPRDLQDLRTVLVACRTLERDPIAQELHEAEAALQWTRPNPDADQKRKTESARRLLIQSNDTEAANVAALWISIARGKRSSSEPPFNAVGIEILKSRPRESTLAFLKALAHSIDGHHGSLIKELVVTVAGPGNETSQAPQVRGVDDDTRRPRTLPQFQAPTAPRATARPVSTSWVKAVGDGTARGTLNQSFQQVRDRKRSGKDQVQHAPVHHAKNGRDLNSHFDDANRAPFQLTPTDDNLVLFRSRQLNDNDRMWIERVERQGDQFTITAHRAIWTGIYTVNVTHYDVFAVNFGKLTPRTYRVKWLITPLEFGESDRLDAHDRPIVERPSSTEKPIELPTGFTIANGLPRDLGYPPPTPPSPAGLTQTRPVDRRADPIVEWGPAVNGLQAGISYDNTSSESVPGRVRVGDRVSTKLTVRNVGKVKVSFTTVEPSFRIPTITDTTGKRQHVSTIAYDGPAATLKHQLKPSESMTFDINSCSVAPRQLIYNTDGDHIFAGPGKYNLSATFVLHSIDKGDRAGRLDAGTIDLEVIPADEEQLTRRVSAELKKPDRHGSWGGHLDPARM
jgi:beta-lactamase regulating signal transducer with metallopeptidase domain